MAMQAVEIASVGEVPDNSYRSASGLRISYSKIGDPLDNADHTFTDKRVFQQLFGYTIINAETKEQQTN